MLVYLKAGFAPHNSISTEPPPPSLRRRICHRTGTLLRATRPTQGHPRHRAHSQPPTESSAQPPRTQRNRDTLRTLPESPFICWNSPDTSRRHCSTHPAFKELTETLEISLSDEPPGKIEEGGTIRDGFDQQLDHFRNLTRDSQKWFAEFELAEQERTDQNCASATMAPSDTSLKSPRATSHSAGRPHASANDEKCRALYNGNSPRTGTRDPRSRGQRLAREQSLFEELITAILARANDLRETADALAEIDVFAGWASLAREWDYCRPEIDASDCLEIDGRHPVVEQMMQSLASPAPMPSSPTTPTRCLRNSKPQIALITGPHGGQVPYIRQIALIVLMVGDRRVVPAHLSPRPR